VVLPGDAMTPQDKSQQHMPGSKHNMQWSSKALPGMLCANQLVASMLTLLDQYGLGCPLIEHQLLCSFHSSINSHLWAVGALPHKQLAGEMQHKAVTPVHECPISMLVPWIWADCFCHQVTCSFSAMLGEILYMRTPLGRAFGGASAAAMMNRAQTYRRHSHR